MKSVIGLFIFLLVAITSGCGAQDGGNCSVTDNGDGTSTILCEDGTSATIHNGQDGTDGNTCTVTSNGDGTKTISCEDGTSITLSDGANGTNGANGNDGNDGADGKDGVNGNDGTDGKNGTNGCTIKDNQNGTITITCADGTEVTVAGEACIPSFKDVPCKTWYFEYVEQLLAKGVFEVGDGYFHPADALTRAELVKFVIKSTNGLVNYVAPAVPTFNDVPATSEYSSYVEAAVQLGIISGYTDAQGNLTGNFGPSDGASRAFTMKVLVIAFAIPTTLSPASPFVDVTPSDWYYKYVLSAYNQSIINGYTHADGSLTGQFAPNDIVTRAQVAKLLINVQSPALRQPLAGTLTAFSEGNPDGAIAVAGSSNVLVAKYRFHALSESFTVNKLTVINDAVGAFDTPVATAAVRQVTIKYLDVNGVAQTRSGTLAGGKITMSNMGLYVPSGQDRFLEVYADISLMSVVGESLSGKIFRLGVRDSGNTSSSFEAVGGMSLTVVHTPSITSGSAVNPFVVRKSVPTFVKASTSTTLVNGENGLYSFTVSADNAGSIGFGRMVFEVVNTPPISSFKLYRGSSLVINANVQYVGINLTVTFNQEETVSAGASQTYHLNATLTGVVVSDTVTTKLKSVKWSDRSADFHSMISADWLKWEGKLPTAHTLTN